MLVWDVHGQAARYMTKALIAGKPLPEVLALAGRLRASRAELFEALQPEELSQAHLFMLGQTTWHTSKSWEARMRRFELELLKGLSAWQTELVLLQTIPGIDIMGAGPTQSPTGS